MTIKNITSVISGQTIVDYERNRMYPPNHRKELPMRNLTLEHSEAVSAAKALLIYKADSSVPAKYRNLLESQITLLGEVYWWILHTIYNPGLPFDLDQTHGTFELTDKPKDNDNLSGPGVEHHRPKNG
ncbi:unnamed protein product [marine sediment metagenome]|uniref:Uncharacterized protein n=1 Tax=marine sediment metagenome TaxID=412755 RepID=X1L0P0_9ZZZZ